VSGYKILGLSVMAVEGINFHLSLCRHGMMACMCHTAITLKGKAKPKIAHNNLTQ
jgi:hypothetical protein